MKFDLLEKCRLRAFKRQPALCYHCGESMWEDAREAFASRHGISVDHARLRLCTAEHLKARREGGRTAPKSVITACRSCNSKRHRRRSRPSPELWCQVRRGRQEMRGAFQ